MSNPKQYSWHKVADAETELAFGENGLATITAGDKQVCISRHNGQLKACAAKCPHAGGMMQDGYLDALGNIVCPLHRYKFSLTNGRNVSGEGYFLKIYPVELRPDGVFIGIEENKFFNWLK